jgi:PAS domain S-box-containing protein
VWVSSQIEAVVGCTRAEWASGYAVWSQRIHANDRERVVAKSEEFMRTGGPPSDEYRVVLPDGRVRWIHERSLLLRSGPGAEPLVHGVVVDVTDERTRTRSPSGPGGCSWRSSSTRARRSRS